MRLLIIRTSALGDIVHCLPVLAALRRHHPEAHIGWVVERSMAPLLTGHPGLDEVLPVGLRSWRHRLGRPSTWREIAATISALRAFRADAVLELMGNHKGGALARASGCRVRIGLERRARREPSSALWINRPLPARGEHAVERALSLLDGLGLPPEPVDFDGDALLQPEPEAALRWLDALESRPIVIVPGTAWGNKTYPAERWGRVARELGAATGAPVWVPAGPGEAELAAAVVAASGDAASSPGVIDLPALAALFRRARLVLGGDTGPTHLAHALGAPVLQLMGPTDPARHGPYGAPRQALAERLPCSFCYRRFAETKACLLALSPRRVVERALELLASPTDGGGGASSTR